MQHDVDGTASSGGPDGRMLPATLFPLPPLVIVTGHYGTGKTSLSLNLAIDAAAQGRDVTLVDLDLVNPYFRSSDYKELLGRHGVRVVAPVFAGTTLDTPSISGEIDTVIEKAALAQEDTPAQAGAVAQEDTPAQAGAVAREDGGARAYAPGTPCVIVDVGGDDVGATALGRFRAGIGAQPYEMLYVINKYRNLAGTPEEAAGLLREIEAASGLLATAIVNNSHLREDTTFDVVLGSKEFAKGCSQLLCLPLACTTIPDVLVQGKSAAALADAGIQNAYPVKLHVRTPWEGVSE